VDSEVAHTLPPSVGDADISPSRGEIAIGLGIDKEKE
jgi:hypothetical protein